MQLATLITISFPSWSLRAIYPYRTLTQDIILDHEFEGSVTKPEMGSFVCKLRVAEDVASVGKLLLPSEVLAVHTHAVRLLAPVHMQI